MSKELADELERLIACADDRGWEKADHFRIGSFIANNRATILAALRPSPPVEMVERVTRVFEQSLARHGVNLADCEGTMDDAYTALATLGLPSLLAGVKEMCAQVADAVEAQQENDHGAANTGGAGEAAAAIRSIDESKLVEGSGGG